MKLRKKVCFIAQFPPPMHGLSKAIETLYLSESINEEFLLSKIDLTNNTKFFKNIFNIFFSNSDLYYLTIAPSKGGNIRDLVILMALYLKRKKIIIHLHSGGRIRTVIDHEMPVVQKRLNYFLFTRLNAAIVLGNSLKWVFEGMVDSSKIFIVPNCCDNESVITDYEYKTKELNLLERNGLHVLYLSNFIEEKGYKDVLELAKLSVLQENIIFHFAGKFFDSEDETYFNSFIKENDLEATVKYHGIVHGAEKKELLALCNIFVLLTRYVNEGQPISILEAMNNGMVIVTTNHSGIPDIASDANGYIADVKHIQLEEIYKYILRLAEDRNELVRISKHNFRYAKEEFSEEKYVRNTKHIFQKIING